MSLFINYRARASVVGREEERNSLVIGRSKSRRTNAPSTHDTRRLLKPLPPDLSVFFIATGETKRRKIVDLVIVERPRNPTLSYLPPTDEPGR